MDRKIAIIAGGVIVNVIVSDAAHGQNQVDITGLQVGIGWLFDGVQFTPPAAPPEPPKKITVAYLISLITPDEQDAFLSNTDQIVKVVVQKLSMYASAGVKITVNERLHSLLNLMQAKGALTQERADDIWNTLNG